MNELDWYRVIDKLYNLSYEQTRLAETDLKEDHMDTSISHMTVALILTNIADALREGLKYKGN
jgi:hypothetical protein